MLKPPFPLPGSKSCLVLITTKTISLKTPDPHWCFFYFKFKILSCSKNSRLHLAQRMVPFFQSSVSPLPSKYFSPRFQPRIPVAFHVTIFFFEMFIPKNTIIFFFAFLESDDLYLDWALLFQTQPPKKMSSDPIPDTGFFWWKTRFFKYFYY